MPKSVSLPYQNFTNASMTGTSTVTSAITNIMYRDSVSLELDWSGTPTGTFSVLGSNSYNPGLPQTDGGQNAGTWTPITLSPAPVTSGSAGSLLINMNQLAFAWLQVKYTNTSGSGILNGWIAAKSLGA
jgi:hypothetical protein